jgi:RNA recognition motif-containing protein
MFDDDDDYGRNSIISRLGNTRPSSNFNSQRNTQVEIVIENLHYNVTEKDVQELFNTVADVVKSRLIFDISGRSTGVATVRYNSKEDAEKAIKKYNNVELDGKFSLFCT